MQAWHDTVDTLKCLGGISTEEPDALSSANALEKNSGRGYHQ